MPWHPPSWRMVVWACMMVALCAGQAVASAAPQRASITDLGRPTNAVPQYVPLGGFQRRGPVLRSGHKPELLFIGTQPDENSAAERWPLVKALTQFGTLTGAKSSTARYCSLDKDRSLLCTPPYPYWRDYPTFNLSHARYTSTYLTFVHKDLIDRDLHVFQTPSRSQRALMTRYLRMPAHPSKDVLMHLAVNNGYPVNKDVFPLVSVGGYLQSGVDVAVPGAMTALPPPSATAASPFAANVTFSSVQATLRTGKSVHRTPVSLVHDYNAEANLITALICHADGKKPRSVCSRPAVKSILKHVK